MVQHSEHPNHPWSKAMSAAETIARFLELLAFAGANFAFAAGLRAWFRWPLLRERTATFLAAAVLTGPVVVAGLALRDAGFIAFGALALAADYVAILAGLRFAGPSSPPRQTESDAPGLVTIMAGPVASPSDSATGLLPQDEALED